VRDKPAYLPLYVRDFLSDQLVLRLSWIEQGIHLRMLMASWEGGPLPDDPHLVAHQIGWDGGYGLADDGPLVIDRQIRSVWGLCWVKTSEGWVSPRLEQERTKNAAILAAQRERAANARANASPKVSPKVSPNARLQSQAQAQEREEPPKNPPADAGTPPPQAKPAPARPRAKKPSWKGELPLPLGGGRFSACWSRWLTYRKDELRKPVTQISGDQALAELAALGLERACIAIEHTIARGWQGIREPEPPRNGHSPSPSGDVDATLRRLGLRKEPA
jgi:uncharacterized protein YdaU (DUF1376 family)